MYWKVVNASKPFESKILYAVLWADASQTLNDKNEQASKVTISEVLSSALTKLKKFSF